MSDNKNYYYLKLKDNFFDSDEIKILENMPNGYKYSNILLKLYLKSLKFSGALRLNEYIPYNLEMIAALTGHDIDTVRVAITIFEDLKLIETLDNGTIYMLNIQSLIGKSSTEADRKREYRLKIEKEKKLLSSGTSIGQMSDISPTDSDKNPPEIELESEIELDKDIDIEEKDIDNIRISWKNINSAWNSLPGPVKHIRSITAKRKEKIKARINSLKITEEDILLAIGNINKSKFLKGENDRGWVIDFDWLFKDDNSFTKVLEGKYEDKEVKAIGSSKNGSSEQNNKTSEATEQYDFNRPYEGPSYSDEDIDF